MQAPQRPLQKLRLVRLWAAALVMIALAAPALVLAQDEAATPEVVYVDATPPVVYVPGEVVVASADGAGAVAWFEASASDETDGPVGAWCVPASGSWFGLGATWVSCSAQDSSGNVGSAGFNVVVYDAAGPVINWPGDVWVTTTDPTGAAVAFAVPGAWDAVDGAVGVSCDWGSGAFFPVGTSYVTCWAQDWSGNPAAPVSFAVTVEYLAPPPPDPAPVQTEVPVEVPAEEPSDEPAEEPSGEEPSGDDPAEEPSEEPSDDPGDGGETPAEEPAGEPGDGGEEPGDAEPTGEPGEEAPAETETAEPGGDPAAEPTEESTGEPAAEPTSVPSEEVPPVETQAPAPEPTEAPPVVDNPEPVISVVDTDPVEPATDTSGQHRVTPVVEITATPEPVREALELPYPLPPALWVTGSGPIDDLEFIWGYEEFPLSQEFGHTDFSVSHASWYAYGATYGLDGLMHPGLDVAMPAGTPLYSPIEGTVKIAGGVPFFTFYGNGDPGVGELLIETDDGHQVILGHMGRIAVEAGDRVSKGDFVGLSGGDNGDHLHLEVREREASGGYVIVDPRHSFLIDAVSDGVIGEAASDDEPLWLPTEVLDAVFDLFE
jgi:murein DD-endopeptidase MepM/ murein hydrolase activator NlpD